MTGFLGHLANSSDEVTTDQLQHLETDLIDLHTPDLGRAVVARMGPGDRGAQGARSGGSDRGGEPARERRAAWQTGEHANALSGASCTPQ